MSTATLQPEAEIRRDDLRLAELVGFLSGYPTLDALEVIQANDDPDPLARVARALVRINRLHRHNGVPTTIR
jgi:hypothetical protein